ncbi:HIT family protein [Candidatus Saccharibacteria bacterium]|nr:HIT family protein [Candidatus Saccharibacteria bacterium]
MQDSIFTKIIKGEISCHKVYEDELTIAFMDINPVQPGMVLVIPKKQIDHFTDLPDEDYEAVMRTVKKVGVKMREVFSGKRVAVMVEGLDVPHAHVKLFPFASPAEYRSLPNTSTEPNHPALAQMAEKLKVE